GEKLGRISPREGGDRMVLPRRLSGLFLAVLLAASAVACGAAVTPEASPEADDCVSEYDANTDYFPVKQTLRHATNFTLSYAKSYQVLTVQQPSTGAKPEKVRA